MTWGRCEMVPPHEVLHLLLDAKHDDYPDERGKEHMLWHDTIHNGLIKDTKRISEFQEQKIHSNPLAK